MSTRAPRHASRSTALDLPARPARSAGAGAFRAAAGRAARVVPPLADLVATRRGRHASAPARPRHAFLRSRLARALAVSVLAGVALLAPSDASAQTAATVLALSSSSADGTYNLGDTISLNVTFSAAVTVTGTPQLALEIGTDTLQANYASGSGTQTLQFDYEVVAGNEDTDGIKGIDNGLTLNGGTISAGGIAAGNSNLSVSGSIAVINAVPAPTVSGVALTSTPNNAAYHRGEDVEATVTFDAAVDITGTPQLELDFDGTAKAAACTAATNTTAMVCIYTVAPGDSAPNGIAIAANKLTGGTITATGDTTAADLDHSAVAIDANHKVDGIRPTLVTTGTDAPTTSADGTKVILTFSEELGALNRNAITIEADGVALSTTARRLTGTRAELTLATALTAAATNLTVALAANSVYDDAGNPILLVAATVVTNAVPPTVTGIALTSTPIYAGYGRGAEVEATVTFDAAVDITGTPKLELDFAGTAKAADCTAATNTTAMVCIYRVVPGDSAPNGIAIAANKLTGDTITATGDTTISADLDHDAVPIDAGQKVDGIRPTLVTTGTDAPTTSTDGTTVILTFSEDLRRVNRNLITIQANGATLSTTAASRPGNKAELTLATALTATATSLTVALATNSVFDDAGNGILAVAATAVTNAVVPPDPSAPPDSVKARRGDGEVHLEWVPAAAVPGDPDRAYQFRYAAEGGEYGQWRDIPGGRNARSHTVTGLENGTRYAFELRVRRRASGFGTAAEIRQTPEAPRWSVSTNRRSVHEGEDVTLGIATSNAVGFYSAPEPLTLAVIGRIEFGSTTIEGADPEDYEIRVDGNKVRGYTKDITFLNYGGDFPAQHFDLEVPVGSTSLVVTVKVLADGQEEDQETMSFMVFRGEEWVNSGPAYGTIGVNIERSDAGVVKQLAVADAEATEGEDPSLDFVVTLAPPAAWTVTVDYATRDGTARAGSDYTHTSGTLTFAPGDTAKTVSVPVIDDTVQDTPETLTLRLSNADPPYNRNSRAWGSREAGVLIADPVATGTIRNTEDQAEPRAVSVSDASAAEGGSVVFTVSLSAASDGEVTVDYATSDGTAAAGVDYTATSGTLAFQAGEVTKTISVPVTDDTEDDGGETFTLTLSNASGAGLGDAEATGTIRDTETAAELSADFPESAYTSKRHTGSDDRPQVVVAFSEAVADFDRNTPSVTVTGASGLSVQAHTEDGLENAYMFFMTPDGNSDVTFALVADAACASGGICTAGGTVLTQVPAAWTIPGPDDESLPAVSVSGASAAEGDAVAFTVSLSAASSRQVTVEYATSGGTATSGTDFTAESGTLTFAANETSKTVSVATTDDSADEENETFTLTLSSPANATLGDAAATGTINDNDVSTTPLTASFSDMPASHAGGEFTFGLAFSEEVELGYVTLRDTVFAVTGGEVKTARRQQQGSNRAWNITVEPDGQGAVTITLPETTDCGASGAICTGDGRPLSHSLSATVAGPVIIPAVSASDASAAEGDAVAFTVSLSAASSRQVTVDYATSGGTATSGTDFTAESGTLTFAANETSKTVSVATTDDSADEDDETFTLALSSPANATLGDATATGTINDDDNDNAAPLTASFSNMPASHAGGEFTFGLAFSEEVELGYVTLRDTAFAVTGGEVKTARRQQQGSNRAWNITVEPDGQGAVTITLPETTDCGAVDAICTHDGRPLSHSLSATVVDSASASAGDAEGGDAADDALDVLDGVTPDHAAAALVGEPTLSEAQLKALDRLGNRNGRYDLGDMLSWRDRCARGEARCGRAPTVPGPASAAVLLGVAAAGRRRTSRRPRRGESGRRPACALVLLLAAATAWSCTGDLVGPPAAERPAPATAEAGPGFLTVEWTAPAAGRAIGVLLELEGPGIDAVVGAPGLEVYHSAQPGRHRIVVAGGLEDGPLLRFRVPDRGRLARYRVRVTEVTGEDYGLRDTGEYRAVIALAAQHRQRIGRESPDPRSSVTPPMGPQEGG